MRNCCDVRQIGAFLRGRCLEAFFDVTCQVLEKVGDLV